MKIIGDIRPYTNKNYSYTVVDNDGGTTFVILWQVYNNAKLLTENGTGIFKFGINTVGNTFTLIAKVRNPETNKIEDIATEIQPLAGKPEILDLYWRDVNGEKIDHREVAYLDKVTLVIKTKNIPQGDILKITIFEDEYLDGHGDSSRNMGKYYTKGVTKNGYAYLDLANMSLYQKKLNNSDYVNDEVHLFYAQIHYYNKLNQIKDQIQIKVNNELTQMIQPYAGNNPAKIGQVENKAKQRKKAVHFTFGVFLDGTLNNMYDTELRQYAEGKKVINTSGLGVSQSRAVDIYQDHGDPDEMQSSYENDLSNPAILYKNYKFDKPRNIFPIYISGIGTNTAPKNQGQTLRPEDYKDNDLIEGPAFGMGSSGIMDNVKKAILDVVKELKNISKQKEYIGTITFDVFGFSRGAAAARHFVHIVTHPPYNPIVYKKKERDSIVLDLQKNQLPVSYKYKTMPHFGLLGQLLQENGILDAQTQVNVRFVGIYDTVSHHGLFQDNDIKDLGLDSVNKADYVVHMVAADEHRANFSLADISSVAKTHPESGKKGGIELIYPGVHCDVGGAYEDGKPDNPKRIAVEWDLPSLKKVREELIRQGWFKEDQLFVKFQNGWDLNVNARKCYLEGNRKWLSNQYSYIPLHIMAKICGIKKVPIQLDKLLIFKRFYENTYNDPKAHTLGNHIVGNIAFLERIKKKLEDYTFNGGMPFGFIEYKEPATIYETDASKASVNKEREEREKQKEEEINKDIRFLRNHYLHWNATYGSSGIDLLVEKDYPNIVNGKRKRNVY
ncbi:DUF2235 domain-containing protein [Flavobacterium columnare]|uniref:T6SS phospholipase effector Tle1-like catalytic domain-containing protein n=1 Tax=Flavobacterium columnare TaxID=996 RepID=UPI002D21667C|nr:DUF2235 domain-containing protein [Flavobacterium columnare]MEB3801629.1 DUF2235 domain-containing protein [Flavobacterium columnare]